MPRRRDAEPLTEERLLEAALQLVDEAGMSGLTMRRLGARLGVDAMAVYYYFPNKQALLRRLVGFVFGQMRAVAAAGSWQHRVLDWANAYRELALAHPNLVLQIVTNQDAVDVAAPLANEALYAALADAGIEAATVEGVGDTLVDYVNGYVLAKADASAETAAEGNGFEFSVSLILKGADGLTGTA